MKQSNHSAEFHYEENRERLQTLYRVNQLIKQVEADGLNIYVILPRMLDLAIKQLEAIEGSIIVVNEFQQVEYAWSNDDQLTPERIDKFLGVIVNEGVAGVVLREKSPLIIDNTRSDPRWLPRPGHVTSTEPWSIICTPLLIRQRAIGAITIHKKGAAQFNPHDLDLLTAISNQAASSIENARLYEASQRQLKISALLNEASRVINSSLDVNIIMQSLLVQMNEFLHAEALSIALVDKQSNELVYRVAEGVGSEKIVGLRLPSSRGLSGWVMEHGKPALVPDTSVDARFTETGDQRTGHITRAMICAPMEFKGDVLGTIQAINPLNGTFTQDDLDLLVNLANIASSALANAQQFERTQSAENRYTNLFHDIVDPILLTDAEGYIVEVNRRAFAFWDYSREDLLGKHVKALHSFDSPLPDVDSIRTNTLKVFVSEAAIKDGRLIPVEVYAKRTTVDDVSLIQWIYHDITQQVELEKMRKDLTAMLFHDLQSPLGNVISSLELLSYEVNNMEPDSAIHSMLDIAKRSSHRLQTLVRSLLDVNRLEAGNPITEQKPVDVQSLIEEVREIERPNFEPRNIVFITHISEELPHVFVEEDMIRRVLINLVNNALKYGGSHQEITVTAELLRDEAKVLISVCDQGIGVPESHRGLIFEKFERVKQTDSDSKGLGLGLAFCRLAVEAHQGQIWVDDAPGGGARFNFTLPLAPEGEPV